MHEIFDKVIEFLWGIWRFRWIALMSAWGISLVGWLLVAQIDPRYPAFARLFVDTNKVLVPLLDGIAVQPNAQQRIAVMSKTVLKRSNLNYLIDKHGLDQTPNGVIDRDLLLTNLPEEIVIKDVNQARSIYVLEYSHPDANTAKAVVSSLIDLFVSTSFNADRKDNENTQAFLDKQINEYEKRLAAAETRLAAFKRKYAGTLPGEQGGYYQRMEKLVELQRTTELELQEAQRERDTLRKNLAQEEQKIIAGARNQSPYDARIADLQAQLDELLVRYTQQHPQVSILQQSINDLRAEKSRNAAAIGLNTGPLLQESIVYQKISTLLAEAQVDVSTLRVRLQSYNKRLNELRNTVDSIPAVEAKLKQLDRDYETVRTQHETLLNKREAARLTGRIEADSNDVAIRPLDPPTVAPRPTDPDKLLLNILVLMASVAIGVLIAFLKAMLYPVFYNQRSLEHVTRIPVLGSVTLIEENKGNFSFITKHLKFIMWTGALPVVCVILLIIQLKLNLI